MKKKIIALLGMTVMSCALVTGCGGSKTPAAESEAATEAPAEEQEGTDALTEEQTSDEADAQEETEEKTAAAVLEDPCVLHGVRIVFQIRRLGIFKPCGEPCRVHSIVELLHMIKEGLYP